MSAQMSLSPATDGWQAAVLFAVVLFAVAALWTIASVVVHRVRR